MASEYRTALGAVLDRRKDRSDSLLSFLGVLGWDSVVAWVMRLFNPMGGGAAESKDEASDETELLCENDASSSVARIEVGLVPGPP